ncbi:hypothetical protein [Nocardia sp. NPDC005825]|uniref:hypothetical protein n=1 Tax=unclassified Nocardia TaxID=2637762 RepID=UPI0033F020D2
MSGFDDAIAAAPRDAEIRGWQELTRQQLQARSVDRINEVVVEAPQRMAVFPGFQLVLIRPKKRFERANSTISDLFGTRYVVIDEDDDPDQPLLRKLSEALAKCYVEHERGTK